MSIKVNKTKSGFKLTKTDKKPSNAKGWKKRYDIHCPYCLHEMQTEPSLFHMMGVHTAGMGECSKCHESFEIHFMETTNTMTTHKIEKEPMQ